MFEVFEKLEKFAEFTDRETGPFCFMALLTAHGAVPGASALPVPAERPFLSAMVLSATVAAAGSLANVLKNELSYEGYGFMNLLEETGAVPQATEQTRPGHGQIITEARNRIAVLATHLTRELKFEDYDFMDLLADWGR